MLGSSRKLGRPAEHLVDGNEKRIWRSTFEVSSPHVIEKRTEVVFVPVRLKADRKSQRFCKYYYFASIDSVLEHC